MSKQLASYLEETYGERIAEAATEAERHEKIVRDERLARAEKEAQRVTLKAQREAEQLVTAARSRARQEALREEQRLLTAAAKRVEEALLVRAQRKRGIKKALRSALEERIAMSGHDPKAFTFTEEDGAVRAVSAGLAFEDSLAQRVAQLRPRIAARLREELS